MEFTIDMDGCRRLKHEPEFTFVTKSPAYIAQLQAAALAGSPVPVTTPAGLRFNAYVIKLEAERSVKYYGGGIQRVTATVHPTGVPLEPLTAVERARRFVDVTCYGDATRKFLDFDRAARELKATTARACYDEAQRIRVELCGDGTIKALESTPNCRCSTLAAHTHTCLNPKKEKTPVKIKKFYVASKPTVEGTDGRNWGKDTLAEAIAHATQLARERGEAQYVVKVIKVVAKREEPITVKDVK